MRICHVVSGDPYKHLGGTPLVVKCLRNYIKSDYVCCKGRIPFVRSFIYPFFIAIWLSIKKYDLVVMHDTAGYVYSILPKFMRSKTVAMCQGVWTDFGELVNLNKIQKIKTRFAIWMQKTVLTRADIDIVYCNYVRKRVINDYNIPNSRIKVVFNGVDTQRFYPMRTHNKDIAIWVSDNPIIKKLNATVEYVKRNKMKLIVIGVSGKDSDIVKYQGKVDHDKMPLMYNKAGTFINFCSIPAPSLTLLEAMSCGLNIITTDVEIIRERYKGLYRLDGESARKLAMMFDWKNVAKKHMKIYKTVYNS